jgi:hypothetical protein
MVFCEEFFVNFFVVFMAKFSEMKTPEETNPSGKQPDTTRGAPR